MASKSGVTIIVAGEDKTGAVMDSVQKHLAQVAQKGEEANATLTKSVRDFQESITMMRDVFVLDRVYEAMQKVVESSIDFGMEMGHLAEQTGISVENLSALKYMADATGVSFESFTKGFKKMSTDIFEWEHGEKLAGEAFQDLGFSLEQIQAKGQDMYGIMAMIADKFKDLPSAWHL